MARNLTDEDIEALCLRLTDFSGLTPEEHRDHHRAVQIWLEDQRRKAEFRDKVKQQIGGWAVISFLTAIGYAAWNGFIWTVTKGHM
jgi:hypothetical protein